jgi:hypothetical protein
VSHYIRRRREKKDDEKKGTKIKKTGERMKNRSEARRREKGEAK